MYIGLSLICLILAFLHPMRSSSAHVKASASKGANSDMAHLDKEGILDFLDKISDDLNRLVVVLESLPTTSTTTDPNTISLGPVTTTSPDGYTPLTPSGNSTTTSTTTSPGLITNSTTFPNSNATITLSPELNVTTTTSPEGNMTATSSPVGNMTTTTSPEGNTTSPEGNMTTTTSPEGNTTSPEGNMTTTASPEGNTTTTTSPEGNTTTTTSEGNMTTTTSPEGNTTSPQSNTTTTTSPEGNMTTTTSPESNTTTTSPEGNTTTTTSPEGNMTTTTSPEGNTTSPEGNMTTTTSPEGNMTTTTSPEGNTTSPEGNMTTTTSPEGNMTTTTSPEVNMTTTTSPESNTTTTTSPEGNTTTMTSSEGNMTTTTSEGNTTSPEGNTTTTTSPEGNTTFPEGYMTTTTSPEGNMTTTSPEGNTTTTASPETNMTTTTSPEGNMTTNVTKTETTAPVLKKFSKSKRNRNREKIRFRRSVREVPFASIADKSKSQRDEYATHNSLDMQRKQRKLIPAKVLYPSKGEPFSLREWNSTQSPVYLADEHLRDLAHILQTLTTDLQDAVREDAGPSEFMTLANDEAQLRTLTATLETSNTVISTEEKDHLSRLTNFTRMSLSMAQEIVQLRLSTIAEAGTMHVILGITVSGCILLVTILVWTCYRHRRAPSNTDSRDNLSSERNFASPATYSLSRPLSQSSVIHSSSRDSSEVPQADYATSATPGGAESGRRADAMPLHHYPSGRPNERPI